MAEATEKKSGQSFGIKLLRGFIGLMLLSALASLLLSLLVYRFTEKELATSTITTGLALAFSPKGLDDTTQFAHLDESIGEINNGLKEMGFAVTLDTTGLSGLPPREQRMKIFGQVADAIYSGQTNNIAAIPKNDITAQIPIIGSDNPAQLVTADSHEKLGKQLPLMIGITILLAVIYLLLGRGLGRFIGLGWIIILASLPGFAIIVAGPRFLATHSFGSAEINAKVSEIVASLLPPLLRAASGIFYSALAVGIVILLFGCIGAFVTHRQSQPQS